MAGMDPRRPLLVLCQISDGQRYLNSLTKMNVFELTEVIVPNTFIECGSNKLYCDIRTRFPNVAITSVQRRHFSETVGVDLINRYSSPESLSVMLLLRDKFYALSAAAALIRYVEFTQNVHLAPRSLKIEYQGSEDTMLIDLDTANRLELVMCISRPETNLGNSLLGVVNHCRTKGGTRLLRANILQPYFCTKKIDSESSPIRPPLILTILIDFEILKPFRGFQSCITNFSNVEYLLNLCMHVPQQEGLRAAECQLKYTLLLKTTLEFLPTLISALENTRSEYFRLALQNLKDPRYHLILNKILETVLENAKVVKGSIAAHLHGCFAIKTGVNSLLDIAKKTYCEIVQEIMDHVNKLRENHRLPLRISFSASKGFHIQCSLPRGKRMVNVNELPEEFILVQKSRSGFTSYTANLVALDQRSKHVLDEIKLMTNAYENGFYCCRNVYFVIEDRQSEISLLTDIRENIGCLFTLCEIIAELDVLVSFAQVSSAKNFSKPNFGLHLDLKKSRHPILDCTQNYDNETVPNDVLAKNDQSFTILTGPNQSGKSIYIRQIALLQIMAQIGCFVPAEKATFKLMNRIFSRISFDDSIESNACTLMVEMRDIDYIKRNATSNSLVIIDELCRGTSVEEGTNLAFAICEQMLDTGAFIFFTTHYLFLTKLEEMYSNVINCHFESKLQLLEGGKSVTRFSHTLMRGPTQAECYGLRVAELTSFPRNVWAVANTLTDRLRQNRKSHAEITCLLSMYKLSLRLKEELTRTHSELSCSEIKPIVLRFKKFYLKLIRKPNNVKTRNSKLKKEISRKLKKKDPIPMRRQGITKESIPRVQWLAERIKKKYRKMKKIQAKALRETGANDN
ncbi:hypothetical protein RUM43_003803 [Polyplax serrata]|uniref:DNA mismatch repair proteins mutS family domain-containing protein n=1 Tax=Polyplax serrata TaxID=468196 RepID=A0AAN8PPT8_POLSC